ncbi:hypothetical protein [Dactylosporangium cerinum]
MQVRGEFSTSPCAIGSATTGTDTASRPTVEGMYSPLRAYAATAKTVVTNAAPMASAAAACEGGSSAATPATRRATRW